MNIALVGFGAMGTAIKEIAEKRGHTIKSIIHRNDEISAENMKSIDCVIDFSHPDTVLSNIERYCQLHVQAMIGTTGWYEHLDSVETQVRDAGIGLLWSANCSIGVNLYFKMVEYAASLINKFPEYDIWATEIHHNNKVDSPSGTAKKLGDILLNQIERKTEIVEEKLDRRIEPHEIHFSSTRGGPVNFAHTIGFDSAADTISLSHAARNRDGYALGAVLCAEWIADKQGCYSMDQFLNS